MKKPLLLLAFFAFLMSCSFEKTDMNAEIQSLENSDSLSDMMILGRYNRLLREFVEKYPDDIKSPDYLFKAAQSCNGLNEPAMAIRLFDQFIAKYPDDPRVADALFHKGFIYENHLNDKEKAIAAYEEFILKYPNHGLAESAKLAIANIDKTPEELAKEFLK